MKFFEKSSWDSEKVGILVPVACNERNEALESNWSLKKRIKKTIDELKSSIRIVRVATNRDAPKLRDEWKRIKRKLGWFLTIRWCKSGVFKHTIILSMTACERSRVVRVQNLIERQEYSKKRYNLRISKEIKRTTIYLESRNTGIIDWRDQMKKSAWGTSWRRKALKGVVNCDKLRWSVKQELTRRFPN